VVLFTYNYIIEKIIIKRRGEKKCKICTDFSKSIDIIVGNLYFKMKTKIYEQNHGERKRQVLMTRELSIYLGSFLLLIIHCQFAIQMCTMLLLWSSLLLWCLFCSYLSLSISKFSLFLGA